MPYEARQPSHSEKVPNHSKIFSLKDERTVQRIIRDPFYLSISGGVFLYKKRSIRYDTASKYNEEIQNSKWRINGSQRC
ncbi:hypothetical protein LFU01_17930 [Lysinibacillus fusiformis]|nr:hypothetical protein LFU01_17930 [Lysinibacillus fusiformis]